MRCLTVLQPWAWAIAHGFKDIENRTWATGYRGPLAIHAGVRWDEDGAYDKRVLRALQQFGDRFDPPLRVERLGPKTVRLLRDGQLTSGAVVAVVDLVGVCTDRSTAEPCGCGVWAAAGQCHWRVANPRPLAEPVPCKGRLSLWDLPAEVETAVRMQIAPPVVAMRFCPWCRSTRPVDHVCPASAVGCTEREPYDNPCGACERCVETQRQDLALRADLIEHGTPNDLDTP